jgi:beta-galactosidase
MCTNCQGAQALDKVRSTTIETLQRSIENINKDWKYLENNSSDYTKIQGLEKWENIDLPHTWNQWDVMDMNPGYRRDASWYQKEITIGDIGPSQIILYFEGVNMSMDLYVNGVRAGGHVGGYVGFEIDITQWVEKGANNLISIRVDNSYNPDIVPSQKADFFIYGGITRDVWLKILPEKNIRSVRISTPQVSKNAAEAVVNVECHQVSSASKDMRIRTRIYDPETAQLVDESMMRSEEHLSSGKGLKLDVPNPKLWSPDSPTLYKVVTQLLQDDVVVDSQEEKIGFRWYTFEEYGAFFLNGERLLLRGTHRHEEHAGYGAAMPNELHRADITAIKEMGANFVRLGHYPQDPEVYRSCDELGIIVWDELPWCRGGMGGTQWQENTERLFKEQILQNYNHPSIFFWSLGNEIYWLPDFENGDDENRLNAYVSKLNDLAHQVDEGRMTSIRKYYAGSELVDVFSPSIWSGWYAGVYTNYKNTLLINQKKYPRFLHMEYGGSSHVGRHTENPITGDGVLKEDDWAEVSNQVNVKNIAKTGDWTENYMVDLFDWYLSKTETFDSFAGNAQWAFKDFGTPLRPENAIPYVNQKGLVDREGNPKDAYYVFKSYWSKDPFTYIESHTWTERSGPKDKTRNISVFSNCEEVELIVNGSPLGKKKRVLGEFPAAGLTWDVLFKDGDNQLQAIAYSNGQKIAEDEMVVHYNYSPSEKADHIHIDYKVLPNGNYLVEALIRDKNGNRILDYERPVYFARDGEGELMINYGTPTKSQVIQMANGRAAIEMIPTKEGRAIIEVRNQDFKGSYLIIDFTKDK